MRQAWTKPDTVIVHDWCWNAAAKHADIVLPVTTMLERDDIGMMPRDPHIFAMQQAVAPHGLARDDYDILLGIAGQMGVADAFGEGRDTEEWLHWMWQGTRDRAAQKGVDLPSLAELRDKGWHKIPDRGKERILQGDFFADPDAHPLMTPSGKIELFSEKVAPRLRGLPNASVRQAAQ